MRFVYEFVMWHCEVCCCFCLLVGAGFFLSHRICIGVFYRGLIMSDIMRLSCRLLLVCNFLMSFIDFVNNYLNNLLVTWQWVIGKRGYLSALSLSIIYVCVYVHIIYKMHSKPTPALSKYIC